MMIARRPPAGAARAAVLLACVAVLFAASHCAAQPAAGVSLDDICGAMATVVLPRRVVVGTGCTVWVDCDRPPLTAQACGKGERFSLDHQMCRPASSTPCFEEQWPQPASAATNRAVPKAAAAAVALAADDAVAPANLTACANLTAGANQTACANLTAERVRVELWTPSAWALPTPVDGAAAGGRLLTTTTAAAGSGNAANNYNYIKQCSTQTFNPLLHTPNTLAAPAIPAGVQYIVRCVSCYPSVLCPQSPKFNGGMKGDFMTTVTTDYFACPTGQKFNGQACAAAAPAAGRPAAPPSSKPVITVRGSVTRGIECASLDAALDSANTTDATLLLVDTVCNATGAGLEPVAFSFVSRSTAASDTGASVAVTTLKFDEPSLMRWTHALTFNVTTGRQSQSGDDQFVIGPTLLSSFVAIGDRNGGTCLYVPFVNGTAVPPGPGAQCPNPQDPRTLMTVQNMPWAAVGAGAAGAVGATVAGISLYSIALASSTTTLVSFMGAATPLATATFSTGLGAAMAAGAVSAAAVAGAVFGVVLLVAAAVLLILILTGVLPPDLGISSGCFSGSATVLGLLAASSMLGPVPIGQLALGDALATPVLGPGGAYAGGITTSPVYLFGHQEAGVLATFVELTTASGHTLHMTGGHFLPSWRAGATPEALAAAGCAAAGARMRRAQDVAPEAGDWLCVYDEAAGAFALSPVASKRLVRAQGLFAPFTTSGQLVVNGVVVSAHSDWLLDRIVPAKAAHHLPAIYQLLMAPARAAYALGGAPLINFLDGRLGLVALASAARL